MNKQKELNKKRLRRKTRTRAKLKNRNIPVRLSVFRSNNYIYAQLIDDSKQKSLTTVSSKIFKDLKLTKTEQAFRVGELIAEKAKDLNIGQVVFDRGQYKFHGRVKALAEGVRSKGLKI